MLQGLGLAALYLGLFATTLVFVPKNAVLLRVAATAALVCLTYGSYRQIFQIFPYPVQHSNFACFSLIGMASAAEMILVSRVDAEQLSGATGEQHERQVGNLDLLWRAVCIFFNLRRVGTRWEVIRLRHRKPQGRIRFLSQKLFELAVLYLLVDAITVAPRPDLSLVAREKQTLWQFSALTSEDVAFRFTFTLGYHLMAFISGRFNVTVSTFFTVLFGLSKPEAWPHFNGSLSSCFTVRGFWGSAVPNEPPAKRSKRSSVG